MFRILPDLPPHVVAFEIDGTTTRPDVEALYREVERAMGGGHVHVFGQVGGLGGLTLDALGEHVGRAVRMLPDVGRVDRVAVVSDVPWVATVARLQGSLLPGLKVRSFPVAEREAALAWASEPLAP